MYSIGLSPDLIIIEEASEFLFDVVEGCLLFLGMDLGGVGNVMEVRLFFVGESRYDQMGDDATDEIESHDQVPYSGRNSIAEILFDDTDGIPHTKEDSNLQKEDGTADQCVITSKSKDFMDAFFETHASGPEDEKKGTTYHNSSSFVHRSGQQRETIYLVGVEIIKSEKWQKDDCTKQNNQIDETHLVSFGISLPVIGSFLNNLVFHTLDR